MQTPPPDPLKPANFFSRERRRQRMLQFLEAFDRRSWTRNPELPFMLPFAREELREARVTPRAPVAH